MADFDTDDIVRLGCVQKLSVLHDIVNVLHLRITGGGGLAFAAAAQDFQEYCDDLFVTIEAQVTANQNEDHISVANITQNAVWGNIAWDVYDGGEGAGDMTAAQLALLAWGRTSISRVQIRKYLGVFREADMEAGVWLAPVRAACQNFIDYHITQQTMGNGLVLQGVAWNKDLVRATAAVTGTTSEVPVVQRRRRLGRGS